MRSAPRVPRRLAVSVVVTLAALLLLAACGGSATRRHVTDGSAPAPVVLEGVRAGPEEDVPSALDDMQDPRLPKPLVDPIRVISGGPPPDGIPAIDDPRFEAASDVTWLEDAEAVLAVELGGQSRAYPVQIMVWHEIVNDTLRGVPVAVTYCPLCNSALAFDRRVGKRLVTFGTSGKLYLSDLVMYDRQTESLWSQLEGQAIAGVLAGVELERVPVATVAWSQWREAHPDGWVLSRETGVDRDYGRNPYIGYDELGSDPFLLNQPPDDRFPPKERVLALPSDTDPVAVPLRRLAQARVLELVVADRPVVVFAAGGLRSALDTERVADGRQVAATGVFRPTVAGRRLTFAASGPNHFTDAETGSTWDILGRAVDGPLMGRQLERVDHIDTFWFAWGAFEPETRVVE